MYFEFFYIELLNMQLRSTPTAVQGGRHNGLPAFDFTHFVDFMIKQKIAQGNFDACQYCKVN